MCQPRNIRNRSHGKTGWPGTAVIACALWWLGAGCASSTPIVLKMTYEADAFRTDENPGVGRGASCEIRTMSISDRRSETESLGLLGYAPVRGEGVTEWVDAGIRRHAPTKGALTAGTVPVGLDLEVGVKKLFVQENTLRLHGVVLLEVAVRGGRGDPVAKTYRGDAGRLAWTNSRSELLDVFNRALDDAVGQLAGDLQPLCKPAS